MICNNICGYYHSNVDNYCTTLNENESYSVIEVSLADENLELHWDSKNHFGTSFTELREQIESRGDTIIAMTNGGIFPLELSGIPAFI